MVERKNEFRGRFLKESPEALASRLATPGGMRPPEGTVIRGRTPRPH